MASRTQAAELIDELWRYYRTTEPPEKSVEVWISELLDLDLNNSGDYIRSKFKLQEKWPSNFPAAVKSLYFSWKRNQPQEFKSNLGCDKCLEGLIHAVNNHGERYVFRCGHCRTSGLNYQEITRYALAEHGFKLDWQHDFDGPVDMDFIKKFKEKFGIDEVPF
jgi:hypothetical protein